MSVWVLTYVSDIENLITLPLTILGVYTGEASALSEMNRHLDMLLTPESDWSILEPPKLPIQPVTTYRGIDTNNISRAIITDGNETRIYQVTGMNLQP